MHNTTHIPKGFPLYKGIILAGRPGTGKSTVGQALHSLIKESCLIESSRDVISKIGACTPFPQERRVLYRAILLSNAATLSREQSRHVFKELTEKFGSNIIGELIEILGSKHSGPVIVSGLRSVASMKYLQSVGYLLIYLDAPEALLIQRIVARDQVTVADALRDLQEEDSLYRTVSARACADIVITDTEREAHALALDLSRYFTSFKKCIRCINTTVNPAVTIDVAGYCKTCTTYLYAFDQERLAAEKTALLNRAKTLPVNAPNVLVGISGGKDSTATLYTVREMGFRPLACTFDMGYYPEHEFLRAAAVARQLDVPYERIDIRAYIRPLDYECYRQTASLYDETKSENLRIKFRQLYMSGREHYSITCEHLLPFVRTCQLCRRTVIRAYYAEAVKRRMPILFLGVNEWAGLSSVEMGSRKPLSAIRTLRPQPTGAIVDVVHLPFLLQRTLSETQEILASLDWKLPDQESLVESNSNSCLFARAAETKAYQLLDFHPDTTRLAREVTVGFLSQEEARGALGTPHEYHHSVREVLQRANIV